ncbi:MAG TPA: phosphate ABC transporter substrate-binding protein [Gammaproteobacteria bacterium]|nr:phosphate ABC transporter substrate-binding protein [Gammaproteobacteria bacterium]
MKHSAKLKIAALCAGLLYGAAALAEVAVIVNPGSGVSALTPSQAKALFLGKSRKFPNGAKAIPVDQKEGSATRSAFNEKVLKKSDSQVKAYWSKMVFSGKASPLKSVADDAAVKDFVAGTDGAVGYIDSSLVDDSVTVVLTVP